MSTKKNSLNWFEIAVADFDRAKSFYESVLDYALDVNEYNGMPMGCFQADHENGVGGAIIKMEECQPGVGGTTIYLNVEGDIDGPISRVVDAGGKIIKDKFAIPPHGFIAIIEDTEGNIVGLHSMS